MTTDEIVTALRDLRFSSGLSEEDMLKLAAISELVEFRANETIFSEGGNADAVYLLRSGRVELSMNIPATGWLPILTVENGDLLGGSPLLLNGPMTLTAVTILETQAIKVDAKELRALCEADHDIGYEMMRRVAIALMNRLVATRLQVLDVHRDALVDSSQASNERPL